MKTFNTEKKTTLLQMKPIDNPENNKTTTNPKFQTFVVDSNSNKLLSKKLNRFKVLKFVNTHETRNKDIKNGRWTLKEHIQFLQAITKFGIKWFKVRDFIPTRTSEQIISHAQKFYKKLKKYKDEELGIDFTKHDIKNLQDMINYIRNVNNNYNIVNLFLYISEKIYAINEKEKNKTNKTNVESKQSININVGKNITENSNIFNNINNESNLFHTANNNYNNHPMNNISITNLNFIINYNYCDPLINGCLNNIFISNNINDINTNINMTYNNILNLNNCNNNNDKELLNKNNFVSKYINKSNINISLE